MRRRNTDPALTVRTLAAELRSQPARGDMVRNARGRYARNWELAALFGAAPGHHLPDCTMETTVQGIRVVLLSRTQAKAMGLFHRVREECPGCQRLVPAGRMHQHAPTCIPGWKPPHLVRP